MVEVDHTPLEELRLIEFKEFAQDAGLPIEVNSEGDFTNEATYAAWTVWRIKDLRITELEAQVISLENSQGQRSKAAQRDYELSAALRAGNKKI